MSTSAVLKAKTIKSPVTVMVASVTYRVAALLTVVLFSLLVNLGLWQTERGKEKLRTEKQLAERSERTPVPLNFISPVSADMKSEAHQTVTGLRVTTGFNALTMPLIYLDNQVHEGNVGYLVYQIVRPTEAKRLLLMELGFVKAGYNRAELPAVPHRLESGEISGRLYEKSHNPLSSDLLPEHMRSIRIQNLNFEQLESQMGIPFYPFVLQPEYEQPVYLSRPWQPLNMSSGKHFGYAFQWFSMAVVWLALMITYFVRKYRTIKRSLHE